jgi:Hyaluronidase
MKQFTIGFFTVGLAIGLALTVSTALGQTLPSPKSFLIFDGTLYSNKPDLSADGLQPINIVYGQEFGLNWLKQADLLPPIESVQTVARKAQLIGAPVVLDIEHWPLQDTPDVVRSSLQRYMTVLSWFQNAAPGLSVGYYGFPPLGDYWRAIKGPSSQEYQSWMGENDQLRSLAEGVAVLYPSLYTYYRDRAGWKKSAMAQIAEARRYAGGKPVYVFLWPQFYDPNSNSDATFGGSYLPDDYWLLELMTAKEYADGIVIWGGWDLKINKQMIWDDSAPWWKITKAFMKSGAQSQPTSPTGITVR